jgi:hypothetical protein
VAILAGKENNDEKNSGPDTIVVHAGDLRAGSRNLDRAIGGVSA